MLLARARTSRAGGRGCRADAVSSQLCGSGPRGAVSPEAPATKPLERARMRTGHLPTRSRSLRTEHETGPVEPAAPSRSLTQTPRQRGAGGGVLEMMMTHKAPAAWTQTARDSSVSRPANKWR